MKARASTSLLLATAIGAVVILTGGSAFATDESLVTDNHPDGGITAATGQTITVPSLGEPGSPLSPAGPEFDGPHLHGFAFGHGDPTPGAPDPIGGGHGAGIPIQHANTPGSTPAPTDAAGQAALTGGPNNTPSDLANPLAQFTRPGPGYDDLGAAGAAIFGDRVGAMVALAVLTKRYVAKAKAAYLSTPAGKALYDAHRVEQAAYDADPTMYHGTRYQKDWAEHRPKTKEYWDGLNAAISGERAAHQTAYDEMRKTVDAEAVGATAPPAGGAPGAAPVTPAPVRDADKDILGAPKGMDLTKIIQEFIKSRH